MTRSRPLVTTSLTLAGTIALAAAALAVVGPAGPSGAAAPTCAGQQATIVGTPRADFLTGTDGPDVVYLSFGNDRFDGRGGDDIVCGGGGNDTVRGDAGDDRLYGEDGDDALYGGADDDTVVTGAGRNVVVDGAGDDTLRGGPGTDLLSYFGAGQYVATGVRADVPAGTVTGLGDDTISRFERYDLTRNTDTFRGGDASEQVDARGGDDAITTGGGGDTVFAGPGVTRISTGAGNDAIGGQGNREARFSLGDGDDTVAVDAAAVAAGGPGNDYLRTYLPGARLDGDAGSDTVLGSQGRDRRTGVLIDLTAQVAQVRGASGRWVLSSIENAVGSPYDDLIYGTRGANVLRGQDGDDVLEGRGGDDTLDGGLGDDTVVR